MRIEFFGGLIASVDGFIHTFLQNAVSNMVGALRAPLIVALTLWVVIWGWAMIYGWIEEPLSDGVRRMIKLGLVLTVAMNVGNYMSVIVNFFQVVPDHLAKIITGGNFSGNSLDNFLNKVIDIAQSAWHAGGLSNLGMLFIALIVFIVGGILSLLLALSLLFSKLITAVLLALGPIFILCTLFKGTQKFFELWLSQLVNFVILYVVAVTVGNLVISMANGFIDHNPPGTGTGDSFIDGGITTLMMAVGIYISRSVAPIASALAGGVALGTVGMAKAGLDRLKSTGQMAKTAGVSTVNAGKAVGLAYKKFGIGSLTKGD